MKHKKRQGKLYKVVGIASIKKMLGRGRESFNTMLDELPAYLWMHDENYTIVYANHAFKEKFGNCTNQKCYQCLMGNENACSCCRLKKILKNMKAEQCKLCKRVNFGYDINIVHMPIINKDGQKFIIKSNLHINYLGLQTENISPSK
ncbi:MAG: hypothetical protein GY799_14730 [Desulfobulbaceae bacterium]|nr:hypothetical protein [Desulfobulbaceae bacterium]